MSPVVIFDFDGVLADSYEQIFKMVEEAFSAIGMKLNKSQYSDFYLTNVKLAEKKVVNNEENFLKLQKQIQDKTPQFYKLVNLFPFVDQVVNELSDENKLAIVSSTRSELVTGKLAEKNLDKKFDLILGAQSETSKRNKLISAMKELKSDPQDSWFVSDTVGDINEGNTLGMKTIAVTWGFHPKETLAKAKPSFIVNSSDELLSCIKST
ncbi:hypothetical protein CL622_06140 [archaeon]|nr:hypothetical protein [archaeon]